MKRGKFEGEHPVATMVFLMKEIRRLKRGLHARSKRRVRKTPVKYLH